MSQIDQQSQQPIEAVILKKVMNLNAVIHGVVFGIVAGTALFIATLVLVIRGGPVVGPHLGLLGNFFIGYDVSILGSFVGLFYGFVTGFLVGYTVARLYNWIAIFRNPAPAAGNGNGKTSTNPVGKSPAG